MPPSLVTCTAGPGSPGALLLCLRRGALPRTSGRGADPAPDPWLGRPLPSRLAELSPVTSPPRLWQTGLFSSLIDCAATKPELRRWEGRPSEPGRRPPLPAEGSLVSGVHVSGETGRGEWDELHDVTQLTGRAAQAFWCPGSACATSCTHVTAA